MKGIDIYPQQQRNIFQKKVAQTIAQFNNNIYLCTRKSERALQKNLKWCVSSVG